MEDAAGALDWSRTKILRGEAGTVRVTLQDLRRLADVYGATDTETTRLERLLDDSRSYRWWQEFEDFVPVPLDEFLSLESQATRIEVANTSIVPGLFQSREYTEAVFGASAQVPDPDRREALVELRTRRQRVFDDETVSVQAVLGEALLLTELGGLEVLQGQLRHLLRLSDHPRVEIRVIPLKATQAIMSGNLTLFSFDEPVPTSVSVVEHQGGMTLYDSVLEVRRLQRAVDHLKSQALSTDETKKLITSRLEEM